MSLTDEERGAAYDAGSGTNQGAAPQRGQEAWNQRPIENEKGRTQSGRRPSQLATRSTFNDECSVASPDTSRKHVGRRGADRVQLELRVVPAGVGNGGCPRRD